MKGSLNNHTENSLNQSVMSAEQLIDKAVEMNMTSVAITNLDNVLAIPRAMKIKKDKEYDINIIAGAEIRVGSMDSHLIMLAKNHEGFMDLCNIITEANSPERVQTVKVTANKEFGYPIASIDILKHYNHGNLIVLSGGKDGIINSILNSNASTLEVLEQYQGVIQQHAVLTQNLNTITGRIDNLKTQITEKTQQLKQMQKVFDQLNTKFQNSGAASLTQEEREFAGRYTALKTSLDSLKSELDITKMQKTSINKSVKEIAKQAETARVLEAKLCDEQKLYQEAYQTAALLKEMYGNDFYIELQNHMLDTQELKLMKTSFQIAVQLGIPCVATNDVYMPDGSQESILARQIIKFNGTEKFEELAPADKRRYLLSEDELFVAVKAVTDSEEEARKAVDNIDIISGQCHLDISQDTYHYPKFHCIDSAKELEKCAHEGLNRRYAGSADWEKAVRKTEYELSVIQKMGFCDYLLIVKDFLEICRMAGTMSYEHIEFMQTNMSSMTLEGMLEYIKAHTGEDPAESIGPGRGSAAGSIVCYEIGITNIDPIKYGLMFERFLNPERVSMPDIDSDFSYEVRPIGIEFCRKKYGEGAVCGINTESTASAKADIKLVARAFAKRDGEGFTESEQKNIQKQYLRAADDICRLIPNTPDITLKACMEDIVAECGEDPMLMNIVNTALTMEGCVTNYGTHAAGIIIGDQDLSAYIAKMWDIKNKVYKVQCDMNEAEGNYKLLKMDFLGLRTLSIITKAVRLIKKHHGITIDIDQIPFEPEVFREIFCKRRTADVFQFESNFMKDNLRQMPPNDIMDLIMINAVGRPGPMDFIPDIAAVKSGEKLPEYLIPEMEEILKETYGFPVYQEQIIQLMQLAGMSAGEADNVRRHMSKKHTEEFEAYRPKFVEGMVARGADRQKTVAYWDSLVSFSKYAFNKSHAAIYSVIAYQTAWLKYHYPTEFLCACMIFNEQIENIPKLLEDAKDFGVEMVTPNINNSHPDFDVIEADGKLKIQFGICSVKGCGDSLTNMLDENEYFQSLGEFIDRKRFPEATVIKLVQAGAMDDFGNSRTKLKELTHELYTRLDKIKDTEKKLEDAKAKLKVLQDNASYFSTLAKGDDSWKPVFEAAGIKVTTKTIPNANKLNQSISEKTELLEQLRNDFYSLSVAPGQDDELKRLAEENEVLGSYVSGHPADLFEIPTGGITVNQIDHEMKHVKVMGLVKDLRIRYHKENGQPMAFFTLEDGFGSIKANCFTKAYANFGDVLEEGRIVEISGSVKRDSRNNDPENIKYELCVTEIRPAVEKKTGSTPMYLCFDSREDYIQFTLYVTSMKKYVSDNGMPLYVVLLDTNLCYDMQHTVDQSLYLAYQQYKQIQ